MTDPRCSRVHASITASENQWWILDNSSRNGTFVNGQKADRVSLIDGTKIKIGSTSFIFCDAPPKKSAQKSGFTINQTLILDEAIDEGDTGQFALSQLSEHEIGEDFFVLFQLAIRLLGTNDPREVVRISLDLAFQRTDATLAAFYGLSDDGHLKPQLIIPENAAGNTDVNESLADLLLKKKHAVRLEDQVHPDQVHPDEQTTNKNFSDSIYVPLIDKEVTVGAIHLFRDHGRFRNGDYQIARSLANILVRALARAHRQASLEADHKRLADSSADSDELVGESSVIADLKNRIQKMARATGCVLVRGESGSGKELVARALHKASPRADRPMLSVNCAAMPSHLMESQLFGHRKGAFTGADNDHVGWFEQADSSTLFLDEIGELSLDGQAKLLRILEGHPFLPVGGTKEISVDVRVIAATNRDLREYVSEKKFREDLYFRLTVFELEIPPLRDRGKDVHLLVDYFLDHFRLKHGRMDLGLSDEARRRLIGYQWPGNVRQLRNVIDSAVVMAELPEIMPEDLGLREAPGNALTSLRIDEWERKLIQEAIGRTNNNVPEAAKLLGISRATLYRKIDDYGIDRTA